MKRSFLHGSSSNIVAAAIQVVGLTASLGLAGCATPPVANKMARTDLDINPIAVRQDVARLEIPVSKEDTNLRPDDQRALSTFVADYKQRGRGALVVSFPTGAPNATAAVQVGEDLRRALYGMLSGSESVAAGTYQSRGAGGPIKISYERYVTDMKECPSAAEINTGTSWSNKVSPSFGCAINSNIAMMLADPGDVVAPPEMTPSDANRRATALDRYRDGQPSGTPRTNDERGAVSQALGQ